MLRFLAFGSLLFLGACGGAEGYFSDRCHSQGLRYGSADHSACVTRNEQWLDWTTRRSTIDGRGR